MNTAQHHTLPLLVLIDVQNGFLDQFTDTIPQRINEYLTVHRTRYSKVVATQFFNAPSSNYERLMKWKHLQSAAETSLSPLVTPWVEYSIQKNTYSAAVQARELAEMVGTQEVHLCGIDTDVCVLQTAAGLFDAGLIPTVLYDLCATGGGDQAHQAALPLLRRTIGLAQVVSVRH